MRLIKAKQRLHHIRGSLVEALHFKLIHQSVRRGFVCAAHKKLFFEQDYLNELKSWLKCENYNEFNFNKIWCFTCLFDFL